jgi:predicted transcriptional regulator
MTMRRMKVHRLGRQQLAIMQVLWERGEATVAEVHGALGGSSELAYTTVATMLRKMEVKGLVGHRAEGRTFVYRPVVRSETVTRSMADDLLDRLFAGSLSEMVSHLLTDREVSRDELARLERLIEEKKKSV